MCEATILYLLGTTSLSISSHLETQSRSMCPSYPALPATILLDECFHPLESNMALFDQPGESIHLEDVA